LDNPETIMSQRPTASTTQSPTLELVALMLAVVCVGFASTVEAQSNLPPCQGSYSTSTWNYCQGTLTFRSGEKYVGEFKDDKQNGQGTHTWPDGQKYVGEYKDDKPNGQGTMTWPTGQKYVGEFKDENPNGQGTATFPSGEKYVGKFKDGSYSGQGTHTFPNGRKYVGEFKDDKQNGQGTLTFADGAKYVGEFKDGSYSGQGTLTFPNGEKYVGEFKDNNFSGIGKRLASDGTVTTQGYWIANEYFGPTPPPGYRASNSGSRIVMVKDGGTYVVPVLINDVLSLKFTVDSGASDVTIPSDVVSTLIRMGAIVDDNFIGTQKYTLADGSIVTSRTFRIRSLKVGDRIIQNVLGSVAGPKGSLLLGQSFLEKFKSWSMDNTKHELVLE